MGYVIGLVLAPVVASFARMVGLDRDRSFYPTVLIVVASYYILFAVMGGSTRALVVELMAMGVFVALALTGLKRGLWIVALGLVGHGVFDFVHADIISDPGVPAWWPAFCGTYDVVAGILLVSVFRAVHQARPLGKSAGGDEHKFHDLGTARGASSARNAEMSVV